MYGYINHNRRLAFIFSHKITEMLWMIFRPRPHEYVSIWIRNFFFPDSKRSLCPHASDGIRIHSSAQGSSTDKCVLSMHRTARERRSKARESSENVKVERKLQENQQESCETLSLERWWGRVVAEDNPGVQNGKSSGECGFGVMPEQVLDIFKLFIEQYPLQPPANSVAGHR